MIYPVVTIELISISAALMTNQPLVKAYLSEQGRYWTTTNQENDVWIKVNTPKAFLLNQRDLRKRMLIPTQREKKNTPFVLQLANNNLDNWKQMFLLLSHEFHSSLPNAVPCRVDEIKSEDSERTIPRPRSPAVAAKGEKVCVPEASISHLGFLPGRCHHSLEEYFIVILQRMILQKSCLKHPPPASWISLVKCQSWDILLLGPSEELTLFGETSHPELEVCKTNAFSPGRGHSFFKGEVSSKGRRAWQPIPAFLPEESHGQRSLQSTGSHSCRVGHEWSDLAQWNTQAAKDLRKCSQLS